MYNYFFEFFRYPHTEDCKESNEISTSPKIDMYSALHQRNKRMVPTMPYFALLRSMDQRGCRIYSSLLNSYPYRQQIETYTDSNGWIETPIEHFNDKDSNEDNNWIYNLCSGLKRTKEIPSRITRQTTGSRSLSRTSINQVRT